MCQLYERFIVIYIQIYLILLIVDDAWHCFTTTNSFTSIMYLENETRQGFLFDRSPPFRDIDEWIRYDDSTRVVCFNQTKKRKYIFVYILTIIFIIYHWEFIIRLNIDIIIQIFSSYTCCLYVSNKMLERWVCHFLSSFSSVLLSTSLSQTTREKEILFSLSIFVCDIKLMFNIHVYTYILSHSKVNLNLYVYIR